MQTTKNQGINITEADGKPLSSGLEFYWDAGLSQILMQEASDFCPDVVFNQKDEGAFDTLFHKDTDKGVELCGRSKSLENKRVRIPESDLDKFIAAIDQLHAKSERPGIPPDNKAFMHDFLVPNPLSMKSAWRVTTGFSKRLLVLWGYNASASDAVILPLTPTSAKWDDASRRKDLKQLLSGQLSKHKFNWGKLFRFLLYSLLGILLLLLLLMVIGYISEHKCCKCQGETTFSLKQFPYVCDKCGKVEKDCQCKTGDKGIEKMPDGTVKETKPDGTVKETKPDGTVKETKPDGTVKETKPDGTVKETKPDGTVKETKPDGTVKETKPGGTVKKTKPGATVKETKPGGISVPPAAAKCPTCGSELDKDGKCPNICNKCHQEHIKDGKCPKCDVPAISDFTFLIKLDRKTDKGDLAEVVFSVAPDNCMKNANYTVHSWSINGDLKAQGDKKQFSAELSYKMRYVITATVTVDGKEQTVLPYQWNSIDSPAWMIARVGNSDSEYQVICTNSSNTNFKVQKWDRPVFMNGKREDISQKIQCTDLIPSGDNKARVSWSQHYIGEYIMVLGATLNVLPENGRPSKTEEVKTTFVFINGSMAQALISLKFANAKNRVYHCLATNTDGSQHNGTAFAVTDKLLLTNYHVAIGNIPEYYGGAESTVDRSKVLVLSNEKRMFYAKVVKFDKATDLALLRLCDKNGNDTKLKMPAYFIVSEVPPVKDSRVFSVGYPAGTTKFGEPAFVDGKIEHFEKAPKRGEIIFHFSNIQPGYSGGPLIYMDQDAMIIGVNTSGVASDTPIKQGVNIATSATEIRRLFPEIFNAER